MQKDHPAVRLNEPLEFRFTCEVDPTSVDANALLILDSKGAPASGEIEVNRNAIQFLPQAPIRGDLSDSGLAASEKYEAVLCGFPSFCAIRSTDGQHLDRTYRFEFHTIKNSSISKECLVDLSPETGPLLTHIMDTPVTKMAATGVVIKPKTPLYLRFSEPIHPGALESGRAKINIVNSEGSVEKERDELEAKIRVLEGSARQGSLISIEPKGGFLKDRTYKLFRTSLDFTDFGGNPIERLMFNFIEIHCIE